MSLLTRCVLVVVAAALHLAGVTAATAASRRPSSAGWFRIRPAPPSSATGQGVKAELEAQRALTPGNVTVIDNDAYSRHVSGVADMLRYVTRHVGGECVRRRGAVLLEPRLEPRRDRLRQEWRQAAAGLTYGASTLGGAIDFTSPTARNSPTRSLFLDAGDYGSLNGRITVGGTGEKVDGLVTLEGRQWDGYRAHSSQDR
ncbi:MAG: hypothetical protein AB7N65_10920 [Vicinamibacterales bacterium]